MHNKCFSSSSSYLHDNCAGPDLYFIVGTHISSNNAVTSYRFINLDFVINYVPTGKACHLLYVLNTAVLTTGVKYRRWSKYFPI